MTVLKFYAQQDFNFITGDTMTIQDKFQKSQDLVFFGKVNASISHELKNILAIISETAGLLKDLAEMQSNDRSIPRETLLSCSQDIIEEVHRGFATIAQMNALSHSVDVSLKSVNLAEVTDLMIGLAGFLKIAGKIRFKSPPQKETLEVVTCPFQIRHLIYQAIVVAFESAGPQSQLQASIYPGKNGDIRITLSGLGSEGVRKFPVGELNQIAVLIGAEVFLADALDVVEIMVPKRPDSTK
jgi:hypothetical protein